MRGSTVLAAGLLLGLLGFPAAGPAAAPGGGGGGCPAGEPLVPLGEVPPDRRYELLGGGEVEVVSLPGLAAVRVEAPDGAGGCAVLCEGLAGLDAFACPDTGVAPVFVALAYVADSSPTGSTQYWVH